MSRPDDPGPADDLDRAVDDLLDNLDDGEPATDDGADDGEPATENRPAVRRVFWWAKGEDPDLQVAWYRLEYFVEWLFAVYAASAQEVPDCWARHPDVVQELWALMLAHDAWHASEEDPLGPIQFAGHWAATRTRLQLRPDGAVCAAGGHRTAIRGDDTEARRATYPVPRPYGWAWPPETTTVQEDR